ncbi:fatty acid synthase-like isoform X2 [Panonychus citri]|uniref:fatty acid synthase-like isoform X2 n=1 Tax=Panonychus citri TaxID=50023 RepID=UPI002307B9C8|nr:fatty acid synthase-like isoform X2 [Panonychus citri]
MLDNNNIVISGIAGRFPNADDVDQLWDKLLQGKILYNQERDRHPTKLRHRPSALGQIRDLSRFDSEFFEVVYESLWDAGLLADSLRGSRTGFFLGISAGDGPDLYKLDETADPVFIFSRMAHYFDWRGPCVTIDTACASTLDAIIQAHWHIRKGLCDIAVVAGVNTVVDPFVNVTAADIKMLSQSGFERCLDENADGFIRSETVAALVLQRKSSAKRIYGEILGASVNNDGYTEEGITFPNRYAQANAMRSALKVSGVSPSQIDYIEAHITGTQAGDAVETSAILDAYRENSDQPIRLGCIKSNIGHAEASAGINAVIRACKILQTGYLSPNAAYSTPNSRISGLLEGKIIPVLEKQPFTSNYLGVNTFGFGGSNGHIILKGNTIDNQPINPTTFPRLVIYCNRTRQGVENLSQLLKSGNNLSEDLIHMLSDLSALKPEAGLVWRGYSILDENGSICTKKTSPINKSGRKICLIFGDSISSISFGLSRFSVFRDSLASSLTFLKTKGIDLTIKSNSTTKVKDESKLPIITRKVIFQLAVIDLLVSLGIEPDLVIGFSSGSISSRYAANQLNRDSALTQALKYKKSSPSKITTTRSILEKCSKLLQNGLKNSVTDETHIHQMSEYDLIDGKLSMDDWQIINIDGKIRLLENEILSTTVTKVNQNGPEHNGTTLTSKDSVVDVTQFLNVLGHLYLSGHNINISTLYPPIKYPVGRQTPSLSPYLTWDHSDQFSVCNCLEFYDNMTNLCYTVDLTDPEYEEVAHHVYDDRTLMPAVGYIYLLWKAMVFNQHGDSVNFRDYGFRVWDVRILRATIIKDSATFKVFYNPVTHRFNVTFRDHVCVSGFGELLEKETTIDFENYMNVDTNPEALEMTGDRFYLGLKIQGFQYGSKMKNIISITSDHTYGRIKYSGGWIGLADAFVQLGGLTTAKRTPRVPVGFQEFIYDPESFSEALEMVPVIDEKKDNEDSTELEVYLSDEIGTISTYGVFLKGLQFTGSPLKPEQSDIRYARQVFKGYNCSNINLTRISESQLINYFIACDQLLTSPSKKLINLKDEWISYMKSESRTKIFSTLLKSKQEDWSNYELKTKLIEDSSFLLKDYHFDCVYNQLFTFSISVFESELCKKMVNAFVIGLNCDSTSETIENQLSAFAVRCEFSPKKPNDLLVYNDSSLSLCQSASDSINNSFDTALTVIEPGNFVLINYREKVLPFETKLAEMLNIQLENINRTNLISKKMESFDFLQISTCRHAETGLVSVLYKKRPRLFSTPPRVIRVLSSTYEWVDDVQEALDNKEVDRLWLIANDSNRNGIIGLVKCLRFEPFGDKIRYIFWPGQEIADDLNGLESILMKDCFSNINKDGVWGIYHLDEISIDEGITTQSTNCYVDVGKKGDLTSLSWFKSLDDDGSLQCVEEEFNPDQSESPECLHENVVTHFAALNFRDILLATGRLSADAYPPNDMETLIGTEFSGITESSGKRVMGICHGSGIATQILGKNISIMFDVPDRWSLDEAATVPNVYLTVYYALCVRGGLKPGESILIHAGSGGVGQAAISLCLARGCQVFTTVSTDEKRNFLKSMFPQLVDSCFADSRSIQFEEHILRQTNGRGVDLVLNSLTEDKLQSGLRCLSDGGRFLELGKYDIVQNHNFDSSSMRNNCSFQVICLSYVITKICENSWEGRQLAEQFQKFFTQGIETGEIRPIASHIFGSNQVEDAFRLMAKSRHMGKVLIQIRDEISSRPLEPLETVCQTHFYPHKCYIIVGGLGGMGLELAYWMVSRGVQNLVITSRSGFKSDDDRGFIEFLRYYGQRRRNIIVTINDAMSPTMASQLIDSASRLGPIGGIFNLAMVLKDGLFENQSPESFTMVCNPKIQITSNLDKISRQSCPYLDHFVCFSSIATLGSVGQSNYAFANSFMERVCDERRENGLPGLAVQWGPVADVGVAARLVNEKDLIIFGFAAQNIFSCFHALDKFMQLPHSVCQSCVLSSGSQQEAPLFENIFQRIAHILGIKDIDTLDPNTTLNELGLDSLQSIEVKEYFGRQYNLNLDEKPLGSFKIADIRDMSKNLNTKDGMKEETLD